MRTEESVETYLWERATRLSRSIDRYLPSEYIEQIIAEDKEARKTRVDKFVAKSDANNNFLRSREFATLIEAFSQNLTQPNLKRSESQLFVLRELWNGNLIGWGFHPPRVITDKPFQIPTSSWGGDINWDQDTMSHDGMDFVALRVMPIEQADEHVSKFNQQMLPPVSPVKRGPQGNAERIAEAFEVLTSMGSVDPSGTLQSHYPLVRDWLVQNHPEQGFSNTRPSKESLRSTLAPMFQELKPKP